MPLCPPKQFWTPTAGNSTDEYEDASRVDYSECANLARIAICDGASEAAFSREWAQILTEAFVSRPLDLLDLDGPVLTDWLGPCESDWNEAVRWERVPWHGEAKTRAGSLAALLGLTVELTLNRSGGFPCCAVAIGDCCLFGVRGGGLEISFPLDQSGQFNSTPPLICSNLDDNGDLWEQVLQLSGEFRQGDLILLASDAVASWLLLKRESGAKPWERLLEPEEAEWEGWVQERRQERSMRNDDSTLIGVEVEAGGETGNSEQAKGREQ